MILLSKDYAGSPLEEKDKQSVFLFQKRHQQKKINRVAEKVAEICVAEDVGEITHKNHRIRRQNRFATKYIVHNSQCQVVADCRCQHQCQECDGHWSVECNFYSAHF